MYMYYLQGALKGQKPAIDSCSSFHNSKAIEDVDSRIAKSNRRRVCSAWEFSLIAAVPPLTFDSNFWLY